MNPQDADAGEEPWREASPQHEVVDASISSEDEDDNSGDDDVDGMRRLNSGALTPVGASSSFTAASAASSFSSLAPAIRYDIHDHTMAAPAPSQGKRRVWVLPRALLPPSVSVGAAAAVSSTRTSTQSSRAAGGGGGGSVAEAAKGGGSFSVAADDDGGVAESTTQLAARAVRIPHPRHGQPTMYLVQSTPPSSSAAALLCEVQAQAPPNGVAQSWFVQDEVIPSQPHSGELLVVTPVDLTYFALAEFFSDADLYERLSRTFVSASDLYRSSHAHAEGATRTSSAAPSPSSSSAQLEGSGSLFSGVGGGAEDGEGDNSVGCDSSPYAFAFGGTSSMHGHRRSNNDGGSGAHGGTLPSSPAPSSSFLGSDEALRGWRGWAHSAAHHPLLFQRCLTALQEDALLRRFCEVRVANLHDGDDENNKSSHGGAEVYYRPSEAVAVAWLQRKVVQLRASAVLRAVLQLPECPEADVTTPATHSTTTTTTAAAAVAAAAVEEVPMAIAFGVVAEYVPERLHGPLSVACGLLPNGAAAAASSSPFGVKRDRAGEAMVCGAPASLQEGSSATAAVAVAAGPKSASVKRLEKAGRPKGTPTLFSMFASKKKEGGA